MLVKQLLFVLVISFFALILVHSNINVNAQNSKQVIPESYIVVFKDSVENPTDVANEMAQVHGLSLDYTYTNALKGFAATIPQARLDKISKDSRVQFISENKTVQTTSQVTPTGISRINTSTQSANPNKGTGIGVAVIDTGIDLTHPDLKANIVANTSCIKGKRTGDDDNGHGSHVAGTIAALNNNTGVVGVAPEAKLIAVKVLNTKGSGTWGLSNMRY